jgi:hypothetical protein
VRGREPLAVWLLLGAVAAAIAVTYSRLPARELYHVSGSGLGGGASRLLVFLNFPAALIAIGVLAVAYERLAGRTRRTLAIVAALLCAPIFVPGVVRQSDLDARWINVPCTVGVALAVALTATLPGGPRTALRGDRVRLGIAIVLLAISLPWVAAELGFFLNGVPLLHWLYRSGAYLATLPGLPPFPPAVHHGHHHGMDGTLLALSALLLARLLPAIHARGLRLGAAAYLALMLAYGIGNVINDAWLEQVVRRGWTHRLLPSVLEPRPTWAWAAILAAAAVVLVAWFAREPG